MSNSASAIAARGETMLAVAGGLLLRPTFGALVAAEEELGPLFALVERAAAGGLKLGEMVALFWHCLVEQTGWDRARLGEAVVEAGLASVTPAFRAVITQILQGR